MEGYKAEIIESTRNLTVRERIAIKDTTNCKALDQVTFENGSVDIDYDYHVKLKIHNPLSDNPDYEKLVIVDKSGERYITGSKSLEEAMMGIVDEMVVTFTARCVRHVIIAQSARMFCVYYDF